MKKTELKKALKSMKKPELENLVMTLLDHIPKKIIEENEIYKLFLLETVNPIQSTADKSLIEKKLIEEINIFVENFLNGNYGIPNRIIPKAKRSKWRFEVMRMCKEVENNFNNAILKKELADAYGALYNAISQSCRNYLVNSDDGFASIQKNQVSFFNTLVLYKIETYSGPKLYEQLFSFIFNSGLSRETLTSQLYSVLSNAFSSPLALEELSHTGLALFELELKKYMDSQKNGKFQISYHLGKLHEGLIIMMLKLKDYEGAKTFMNKYSMIYQDQEIMTYVLIRIFNKYCENPEPHILDILNKAMSKKIKLRDELRNLHEKLLLKFN